MDKNKKTQNITSHECINVDEKIKFKIKLVFKILLSPLDIVNSFHSQT